MRFDPRRLGARCNECPIFAQRSGRIKPVRARYVRGTPTAVVVAEAPGHSEEAIGEPLSGQSGGLLESALQTNVELLEHGAPIPDVKRIHKTNAVLCRPSSKLSDIEWRKSIACCRPRLRNEFNQLQMRGWNSKAITLGAKALQALCGERHIKNWMGPPKQGEVFDTDGKRAVNAKAVEIDFTDIEFLPTVSPALCLRQPQWTGVFITHVLRGWEFCNNVLPDWEWKPTYLEPNKDQLQALESYSFDKPLAMDCETDGPQHPITLKYSGKKDHEFQPLNLLDIGFSDGNVNVCVQWHRVSLEAKTNPIAKKIKRLAHRLVVAHHKAIWQNYLYDGIAIPAIMGWQLPFPHFDTLIGFKLAAPLLPGNLATQAAIFTHAPRWKDEFKMGSDDPAERYAKADPHERALYCARDCESTFTAYEQITQQLDELHNGWSLFQEQMDLLRIALRMQRQGFGVDRSTFDRHRAILTASTQKWYGAQVKLVEASGGLKGLLHPNPKRDAELREKGGKWNPASRYQVAAYFRRVGHVPLVFTDSDEPSYKASVLEALCKSRNRQISDMARALLFYRKDAKILSTNINGLPYKLLGHPHGDGLVARVHAQWLPFRTKSGRWGCRDPNMQNQKKTIRDMFIGDYLPDDVELFY